MPIPESEHITLTLDSEDNVTAIAIDGLNGSEGSPVVVDCEGITVDAGGVAVPLSVTNSSWVDIKNVSVTNSDASVVSLSSSSRINLSSILAWDAGEGNFNAFGIHDCQYITVTDCAAWGEARKVYSGSQGGNDITWTRCWGRFDRWVLQTVEENRMVFAIAYNNLRNTFTHCIGSLWKDANWGLTAVFGADHMDGALEGTPADTSIVECLAMSPTAQRGFFASEVTGITFANNADATLGKTYAVNKRTLWKIRDAWDGWPIRAKLLALTGVDPIADIEAMMRQYKRPVVSYAREAASMVSGQARRYGLPNIRINAGQRIVRGVVEDAGTGEKDATINASSADTQATGCALDGVDDYIAVAPGGEVSASASGPGTAFTILLCVSDVVLTPDNTDVATQGESVIYSETDAAEANASRFEVYVDTVGRVRARMVNTSGETVANGVTPAGFFATGAGRHYIAVALAPSVTPGASRLRVYVDASGNGSSASGDTWVSEPTITTIGASIRSTGIDERKAFRGTIHQVARFPSTLSTAVIDAWRAGAFPAATCTGRWEFGDMRAVADAMPVGVIAYKTANDAFTQPTAASQPMYDADAIGLPGIVFDGSDDFLQRSNAALIAFSGRVMAVIKTAATNAQQVVLSQANESEADRYIALGISADNKIWYKYDNGTGVTAVELKGDTSLGTDAHVLEFVSDGSEVSMLVDGVAQTITAVSGTNAGQWFGDVSSTQNAVVGAVKTSAGVGSYLNGSIVELVAYDNDVSAVAASRMRAKLMNKYGITA